MQTAMLDACRPSRCHSRCHSRSTRWVRSDCRGRVAGWLVGLTGWPQKLRSATTAGASVMASAVSLQDAESLARSPAWLRYTSADFKATADIQELAAFVLRLRPRSVHDLKPMLQLMQVITARSSH